MTVYIVLLVVVAILGLMAVKRPSTVKSNAQNNLSLEEVKKPNWFIVWLIFLCIAFVGSFRYNVGTDFFSYFKNDRWAGKFNKGDYSEPGFTLLAIICEKLFGTQSAALTIVSATITVALFIFTIAKRQESFPLSIILFVFTGVFTGMFNGLRQYLAAAILFSGYHFVVNKKPIRWLIVVLLASCFHTTALLMFFIYFVCNLKCNWGLVFLYLTIAAVLLFAYEPLFDLVGALKQEEVDMNEAYMKTSVNILRVAVQCVPIGMLLFLDKNKINEDKECRFLLNVCLLNAAIAVAAMNSAYLSRFWIYTSCFQTLMYPKIFSKMKKRSRELFIVAMLFFYALFWAYEIINAPSLYNYYWVFDYL